MNFVDFLDVALAEIKKKLINRYELKNFYCKQLLVIL